MSEEMTEESRETTMNIVHLDKAEILSGLYNAARTGGLGVMHHDPEPMTTERARELLEHQTYFDWIQGRVLKVELGGDELDVRLYDRDNGDGAAARVLEKLRGDDGDEERLAELELVRAVRDLCADAVSGCLYRDDDALDAGDDVRSLDPADLLARVRARREVLAEQGHEVGGT